MNKEAKRAVEEAKTLILIGGFPCLTFFILSIFTACVFPDEPMRGLNIIAYGCAVAVVIAILITIYRMWKMI